MQPLSPAAVRYIKLGSGGAFARACLDRGEIHLDYTNAPHDLCAAGDWEVLVAQFIGEGRTPGKAKDAVREIRDFYSLGPDCLWITFTDGHLWWAFAEREVTWLGIGDRSMGTRARKAIGGWRNTGIDGQFLRMQSLSSKLTQVANYRQTICQVAHADYLVRRINGVSEPIVTEANAARRSMLAAARLMIADLHWADFEIMTDLIFARGGWQRVSVLGETMAEVDLVIEQPTLEERATVQVKSRASQAVLDDHIERYRRSGASRTFFVCHSPDGALSSGVDDARVHVWTGDRLAELAVKSGLYDWLIERVG